MILKDNLKPRLREDTGYHVVLQRDGKAYRAERGALVNKRHALVHAILAAEPDRTPPDPLAREIGIIHGDAVILLPDSGRTITFHYEKSMIRIVRVSAKKFEVWWREGNLREGYAVPDAPDIGRAWDRFESAAIAKARPVTRFVGGWPSPDLDGF